MRAVRVRVLWVALLATACATTTPPPRAPSAPAARPLRADAPAAFGTLEVLLFRGAGPVEIGRTTLARSSAGIVTAGGTELGRSVLLTGDFRGRPYPGQLLVQTRGDELEVRNRVELEEYVAGVLAAELSLWSARPAELEAQAIAARSYAVAELAHRGASRSDPYLFADTRDQAYRGRLVVDQKSASYAPRLHDSVARTRGLVLVENGRVVNARFHAACGGATADGRAVFPELDFDCMRSVPCAPCAEARRDLWRVTAPPATLAATAARLGVGRHITSVEPALRDTTGRWLTAVVRGDAGERVLPFQELRVSLGAAEVESNRIVRTWPHAGQPITAGLFLEGHGRGHGVGLCQVGARGYAERGWSAERILAHYYSGATIVDGR